MNKRPSGAIAPSQPTETVAPLGVAMALRLGRGDLAERIAGVIKLSPRFVAPKVVDDILWARYSRALGHFERGDDASARDDCRWLQTNAKAFIGFGKVSGDGSPSGGYQFQALCADLDRRLQNRSRPPFDSAKNRALPVERRVAEIVDRLEDARGTMECVPGPIRWDGDPVYEAALEIGEPLVDALLDRAEKDSRLTRAVGISGAGPRVRSLVPVRELASRLVVEIADLPVWSAANPGWEALKAQWRATKGLQPAERLLWVLRNDDAGPARWCDAAMRLVKNEYVDLKTGRIVRVGMKTTVRPVLRMKGAPLRSRRNPSVTELMAKRALQTMPKGKWESEADSTAAQQAGDMARSMELWDPVGSKKTRRELSARLSRCVSELEGKPSRWDKDARAIIEVLAKPAARG